MANIKLQFNSSGTRPATLPYRELALHQSILLFGNSSNAPVEVVDTNNIQLIVGEKTFSNNVTVKNNIILTNASGANNGKIIYNASDKSIDFIFS